MNRRIEMSAAYARLALQSGVAPPEQLLSGVAITEQALAQMDFIEAGDLAVIFRNYDRCMQDSAWTVHLGSQLSAATHGPLGFAALSAPTLGEALDVMGQLHSARNTTVITETLLTDSHYLLRITDTTGFADFARWVMEVLMKIVEELLSSILGHPVGSNVKIAFSHSAPDDAEELTAAYGSSVTFDAPANTLAVPLAWRQLPSPLYDKSVYRANVIKCRELIAAREQSGSVAFSVRSQLSNHFDQQMLYEGPPGPPPTLDQFAQTMHMTPRTLIRKLQREETAYKDVLEELRRDYAQRLLKDPRLKVADVAEVLGYREPANFGRAFRRWFGTSPAAWRRR